MTVCTARAVEALYERIAARASFVASSGCLKWDGALSQSGWRAVFYPALRIGPRIWRVNRLVLCLGELDVVVGALPEALARVNALHVGQEASHTCDNSECVNSKHLEWQGHQANVQEQTARRHARQGRRTHGR